MDSSQGDAPAMLDRLGNGWSYHMEHVSDPSHVVVTLKGTAQSELIESYYTDIITIMDRIVGVGIRFLPIIFDASTVEIGQISLPAIMQAPGQVPRRVSKIVVVMPKERGGFIGSFIRNFAGMFPGMSIVATVEDAHASLRR